MTASRLTDARHSELWRAVHRAFSQSLQPSEEHLHAVFRICVQTAGNSPTGKLGSMLSDTDC